MKVITDTKELENALIELRAEAEQNGYDFFKFYLVGEKLIKETAIHCNFITSYCKGFNGLFSEADSKVQGLSLSSEELEFVDVAFIEGPVYSNYLLVDSIFKVVKYKDYLLQPLKFSSDKTFHFEFLETPIKIKVRTPKPNKVSVLTDKKAAAWVAALLEDIRQSELAEQAAEQRKKKFMTKMSNLTNQPEETFAKSGRVAAGLVYIKWEFDENGKAYTSVDFRLTTDEVLKKLSECGLLENK